MSLGSPDNSVLILITNNGMGHAETALAQKLVGNYLRLLEQNGTLPGAIAFYAEGVRLVVEGSPVLDALKSLESRGIHLIICKTCLDYFGLVDKVRVGIIGGMPDIIAAQWKAAKVITV